MQCLWCVCICASRAQHDITVKVCVQLCGGIQCVGERPSGWITGLLTAAESQGRIVYSVICGVDFGVEWVCGPALDWIVVDADWRGLIIADR